MPHIHEYVPVVGQSVVDELFILADKLKGKVIQNVNSTSVGGGVAEILNRMVPILTELGVDARWDVIKGNEKFFVVTKKMHNALHGSDVPLNAEDYELFLEVNRENARGFDFRGDVMFIHDPQPIALVERREAVGRSWIWRCHIDFTEPREGVWNFLKGIIERYDSMVLSAPAFARKVSIPQYLVSPSIDPLSDKNKELPEDVVSSMLSKFGIDRERPVVTQISRFDYLKDPLGVIKVYKMVKKNTDCQLVLAGGGAIDDPEGMKVLAEVKEASQGDPDVHVLFLPPSSDLEINALQRGSTVILQKSLKEGFGLTVAEGLWKAKPVIASAVGGIPLQIKHQHSGILTHSIEGTAFFLKQLLQNPDYATQLGRNGREFVRFNFLITRHLHEYLLLFLSHFHGDDIVHL
jgi:trehalose synthase